MERNQLNRTNNTPGIKAFILITNGDDIWDSPALPTPNDGLISRSRSNSLGSNSTFRGGRFQRLVDNVFIFNPVIACREVDLELHQSLL